VGPHRQFANASSDRQSAITLQGQIATLQGQIVSLFAAAGATWEASGAEVGPGAPPRTARALLGPQIPQLGDEARDRPLYFVTRCSAAKAELRSLQEGLECRLAAGANCVRSETVLGVAARRKP